MSNYTIPRPEHPEPQFEREQWVNLNGTWEFEIDHGASGRDRKFYERDHFDSSIVVPFCPESRLSGVEHTDFMAAVWYRRTFTLPQGWVKGRTFVHFGAVDYEAFVYVNGELAGTHKGGYTPFALDITALVRDGENVLTVCAEDDLRTNRQPRGKQSSLYYSHSCDYTRTTGIWQTVWLEHRPDAYIKNVKFYPDPENGAVTIAASVVGAGELVTEISYGGKPVGGARVRAAGQFSFTISPDEIHLWEPGHGRLYDVTFTYGEDRVKSYFGLRSVRLDGMRCLINGKSVFQRLILDQGFYPDGIYTAPSDAELVADIERSMAMGFNGARLHQKVFEPRFLYHCDRLGYLTWGEYASWGQDHSDPEAFSIFLPEWLEAVERDFSHPSIIGWCPLNEVWSFGGRKPQDAFISGVYYATKAADPTRPCIDASGGFHRATDIFDVHNYNQNPAEFRALYENLPVDGKLNDELERFRMVSNQTYRGEPCFMSEYGGIRWDEDGGSTGWGYGEAPKSKEEFVERYRGLTDAMLDNAAMMGFCYTQLTDVEQEINGLYTYDRRPKVDCAVIAAINTRKAKIEE